MLIVRRNPFSEIATIRHQMDAMFDEMLRSKADQKISWKPAVELQDKEDNLILRAEIPGMDREELEIGVSRDTVTLRGEHRYEKKADEDRGYVRSEFYYGKFERTIGLPVPIQNNKVAAEYVNGILTLTLPKAKETKNQVVKIKLGAETKPSLAEKNQAE